MYRLSFVPAAVVALLWAAASANPVAAQTQAQPVVLRALAGDFEFSGRLKTGTSNSFVIETAMGEVTLDAGQFECVGDGCPGAQPGGPAAAERIAIHGSSTIGHSLMPELIRRYAASLGGQVDAKGGEKRSELRFRIRGKQRSEIASIELQRYGSATAFTALAAGDAEIGMSSRPIKPEEIKSLSGMTPQRIIQHEHVIGLDAVVAIVAPANPVTSLTLDQIARIFAGHIVDWEEFGLPAGRITAIAPDAGTGTYDIFRELVLQPRNLAMGAYVRRMDHNGELIDAVAADPRAIGFASLAGARTARAVPITGACGIAIQATTFSIKTEDYPLSRRLHLYTNGPLKGAHAQGLVRFALSADAQAVVRGLQFVDQRIDQLPFADQAARFETAAATDPAAARQLLADVNQARRLSLAFRFASGSSEFQSKSRQDITRLAELLQTPDMQRKSVMILGFTDEVGNPLANQKLSKKRAEQVRAALLTAGGPRINPRLLIPRGYGTLAPVACNDTVNGQLLNRRVEVWVRD